MTNEYGRLDAGAAYDYFRGWSMSGAWSIDMRKRTLDKTINPSAGYTVNANIDLEKNDFIEGLNFSESGDFIREIIEKKKPKNVASLSGLLEKFVSPSNAKLIIFLKEYFVNPAALLFRLYLIEV